MASANSTISARPENCVFIFVTVSFCDVLPVFGSMPVPEAHHA